MVQIVKRLKQKVGRNYRKIRKGSVVANNQTYLLELLDEHNNTLFIQLSRDGSYWNVNSAGIFKENYSRRKPEVYTRPALEPGTGTDSSEVNHGQTEGATVTSRNSSQTSDSKDSKSSSNLQGNVEENSSGGDFVGEYQEKPIELSPYMKRFVTSPDPDSITNEEKGLILAAYNKVKEQNKGALAMSCKWYR